MYGTEENPGIIRLAAREIYSIIQSTPDREYLVCASMVEVYNENIKDLLAKKPATGNQQPRVREDCYGRITLEADKKIVSTPEQVIAVLREGEKQASRATTNMNDMSSRSHTIFRLYIESKARSSDDDLNGELALQSELNLVDLAGSECAAMTGAEGALRREGAFINKSLLALSTVIEKLSTATDKKAAPAHINYRDSVLTRMLQSSLGGNSKTAIICNISLAPGNFQQTQSTLQFASRAKKIETSAKINEVTDDRTELKKCKREIGELKKQLSLHEAKLSEVALQTIINERDEKVRDLQAEREQLARKLEACMKMISVSNQKPVPQPKPEFNRRFTLACPSLRNFLLSPIKPVAMPFEAPEWSGRPSRICRTVEPPPTEGDAVLSPGDALEKDGSATDPAMLLDGDHRPAKKRKWSSEPGAWPRFDAAVQTEAADGSSPVDSCGRILELEFLLQAASERCDLLQEAVLDAQRTRDQFVQQAVQRADEMARQHELEVKQLHVTIASMEKAELQAKVLMEERDQQLQRDVDLLKATQCTPAMKQQVADLEQQLNAALMARENQRALAEAAAEAAQRQAAELTHHIQSLTSQLQEAQAAAQRRPPVEAPEPGKCEDLQARLQAVQGVADERSAQLAEVQRALGEREHEVRSLMAQEADLRAQLAIVALGASDQEAQTEALQELQLEVERLNQECAERTRTLAERDAMVASLSLEFSQKEAQWEVEKQAASRQVTSMQTFIDQMEEQKQALDQKTAEVAQLQRELFMNRELQQGLQARLTELAASSDHTAALQRTQEEALAKAEQECVSLRQAQAHQTAQFQAQLAGEAEGSSQLHLAVQARDTRVAELEGQLATVQQEARDSLQQLVTVRGQLTQCEAETLQVTQRLATMQAAMEEQEAAARARVQELDERLATADAAQEAHQAELQWWKEQVAQRDGQLQALQEETEGLRLQHGALLREMATVAPALTGARKPPPEKLRDDNVAMQKQVTALKNDVLLKDRKLKAFEKSQEGRAKEMEKLEAKVKAFDEMLKQLRQEKGTVVQELVKKDAELKDCKRKLERVDRESEKYTATLKGERDRLRQAQEELAAVQRVLHSALVEKQQLKESDDARRAEVAALREAAAQQEAVLKEREERLEVLMRSEQTLNANLTEMAALHQKALTDHQAAAQRADALASQLQAAEGRLVRHTEESQQALEELQSKADLLHQQLKDTNELQEILSQEKQEAEAAARQGAEAVHRLTLAQAVLEQQVQERGTECEVLQAAHQRAEASLLEEQRRATAQQCTIEELQASLAESRREEEELRQSCTQYREEIDALKNTMAVSEEDRAALGKRLRTTGQELAELREQHEEAEAELARANTRALELETDRDSWLLEHKNLREELEGTKAELQGCLAREEQAMVDAERRKAELEAQLEQLRAELAGRASELRAAQLELEEKKKTALTLEADLQRLQAEWKADVQGYVREFSEKERHFAKILAENKFLTEEVEVAQAAAQQKSHALEELAGKLEEAGKAHAREAQALREQLEEATRQRRIAVGRLEKEVEEARSQMAELSEVRREIQAAFQERQEAVETVEAQLLQLHGLQDALQQKNMELTLAESLANDLKGQVEDWRMQLLRKEEELVEAAAQGSASAEALKAAEARAAESEAHARAQDDRLARAQAQLAAAEEAAARREKALQGLQAEAAERERARSAAQLAMAQKEGEMECLKEQLQRSADQRKQLEVLLTQRNSEMETVCQQHADQAQQLTAQLGEAQAALEVARREAAGTQAELALARQACGSLEMALTVDRRAHQRKVEQLEEMIKCVKERVAQTEHASESEKVAHRRQTMVISSTELQLRRLQAEKEQVEASLLEAQRSLQTLKAQEAQGASERQQLQEAQDELQEERSYLQQRIRIFEASLTEAGQMEKGLLEKVAKLQEEIVRQRQKHEKQMKKLKENAETRYQMLKEKALDRLDRYKRETVNRRSMTAAEVLGKENAAQKEKFTVEMVPVNFTEGERRIPRRTSLPRKPFAVRAEEGPKAESDSSDTDPEKDATMADDSLVTSPRTVHWAMDGH
eukprot:EG_transcript_91